MNRTNRYPKVACNSGQVGRNLKCRTFVGIAAENTGESYKQVQRFIRVTERLSRLLREDDKKLLFNIILRKWYQIKCQTTEQNQRHSGKNFIGGELRKSQIKKCENHKSGNVKITKQDLRKSQTNNTDINNTDINNTEWSDIYPSINQEEKQEPQRKLGTGWDG